MPGSRLDGCQSCQKAAAESLRWAHGDRAHARDVEETMFVNIHVEDAVLPKGAVVDKNTYGMLEGQMHLVRWYRELLDKGDKETERLQPFERFHRQYGHIIDLLAIPPVDGSIQGLAEENYAWRQEVRKISQGTG